MGGSQLARWGGAAVLGFVVCSALGQAPSLTLIPPPAGRTQTFVSALSMDGRVVTGYTRDENFVERGFTWTRDGGMDEWGARAGIPISTNPTAISSDGSTIVGRRLDSSTNSYTSFRYSNGTYQTLGASSPGFGPNSAFGVSGDASVIVGGIGRNGGFDTAMRWTAATGMRSEGVANGGLAGRFTGISRDGSTTIGVSTGNASGFDAYTWTQAGGWRVLPVPSGIGTQYDARPFATNVNGNLVGGTITRVGAASIPVLWENGMPIALGSFGDGWLMGAGPMSDNGSIIGGGGRNIDTGRDFAAVWFDRSNPVNLQEYLATLGVSTPAGWRLASCNGISPDGRTLIGLAQNGPFYQGFVATIPAPGWIGCLACVGLLCSRKRRNATS